MPRRFSWRGVAYLVDCVAVAVIAHTHALLQESACFGFRQVGLPFFAHDGHGKVMAETCSDEVITERSAQVVYSPDEAGNMGRDKSGTSKVLGANESMQTHKRARTHTASTTRTAHAPFPLMVNTSNDQGIPQRVALAAPVVHDSCQVAVDFVRGEEFAVFMRPLVPPVKRMVR